MKSYFLAAFMFLSSFSAMANAINPEGNNPKSNVTESKLSAREQLEMKLVNNAWKKADWNVAEQNLGTTTFFFNNFGTVEMISATENDNLVYKTKKWRIESNKDAMYLVLSEIKPSGVVELFKMEETRTGNLMLTPNGSSQQTFLNSVQTLTEEELDLLKADLTGSWAHIGYPFQVSNDLAPCGTTKEMDGSFLNYEFRSNGKYQQTTGSKAQTARATTGEWNISPDGKYLTMRSEKGATVVAKVKQPDPNRLSIEQALITADGETLFCTANKVFNFKKQN